MDPELLTLVKQRDYDRYLWALCLPTRLQPDIIAALAFNAEIAPIAQLVSEPLTGAMRLKWWVSALDEIYDDKPVRAHMVTQPLAQTLKRYAIPRALCDRLIEARGMDLELTKGFENQQQFEGYLDGTVGALHQMLAYVCDAQAANAYKDTITDMARIYGICGLLRAIPYLANEGIVRWPLDSLRLFGLGPQAIEQGDETQRLSQFVAHWVVEALEQNKALTLLPRSLKPIMLLHQLAVIYLRKLQAHDYQLSALPARIPTVPIQLWWKSLVS